MSDERGYGTTFLHEIAGHAHVAVHAHAPPRDEEWRTYLEHISEHRDELRGVLVNTLGAGPSAAQRRVATDHWKRHGPTPKMAIMTPSSVVRGMVRALSWFLNERLRAFAIDDFEGAAAYLGLDAGDVEVVRATVERLRAELGV